jgi:hypothetical protein
MGTAMSENDNRLLFAGLMSGLLVGVLGALLALARRDAEPAPVPEGGLVLRRRSDA